MIPKKQGEFSPQESPEDAAVKAHARQMPVDGITAHPHELIRQLGSEEAYVEAVKALQIQP